MIIFYKTQVGKIIEYNRNNNYTINLLLAIFNIKMKSD